MTFSCEENEPVRLYNHEFLEKYLNHRCIDSAPVGGIDGFNWNTVAEGRSYSYILINNCNNKLLFNKMANPQRNLHLKYYQKK